MELTKPSSPSTISLVLIIFLCIVLNIREVRHYFERFRLEPSPIKSESFGKDDKVVIGLVSCQKKGSGNYINEEASMMIKSALMSAKLYGILAMDFHIFIENEDDQLFFHSKLQEFNVADYVDVTLYFHDAIKAIPKEYHDIMLFHKQFRCGFIRHFFPTLMPEVDSIIYLDTDMIVTGNIGKLWEHLSFMKGEESVGVARNMEPEDTNYEVTAFIDIPLPRLAPKAVNSGLMVMNLTRMRGNDFQGRIIRLYDDYSKIAYLEDQKLLNVMLFYDPGLHQLVPCQYDLMHTHCDKGLVCLHAAVDPYGVQIIHGAGDQFDEGGSFHHIYRLYQKFNVTEPDESLGDYRERFMKDLVLPLRQSYQLGPQQQSKCYGILDKLLFKNLVNENMSKKNVYS